MILKFGWPFQKKINEYFGTPKDADDIAAPVSDDYKYTFAVSAVASTTFTLTATPKSGTKQVNDKEHGTPCTALTLDQSNAKTPPECW